MANERLCDCLSSCLCRISAGRNRPSTMASDPDYASNVGVSPVMPLSTRSSISPGERPNKPLNTWKLCSPSPAAAMAGSLGLLEKTQGVVSIPCRS